MSRWWIDTSKKSDFFPLNLMQLEMAQIDQKIIIIVDYKG